MVLKRQALSLKESMGVELKKSIGSWKVYANKLSFAILLKAFKLRLAWLEVQEVASLL
jgi:hypothetical protein